MIIKFCCLCYVVELPNIKLVDCNDVSLEDYDKCLRVKFSYLEEYAGLHKVDNSSEILVGKLYSIDGVENEDSRVSVSTDMDNLDIYHVIKQKHVCNK